ncbi:MAG: hypothetical protein OXM54_05935 [Acidimicrobiaceae bacterium]|nr:hypothetical protein [Acidimicrobiaceae bacterium]
MDDFLIDRDPQTWSASSGHPASLVPSHLFVQTVPGGLEIAVVTASRKPTVGDLRTAWTTRRQRRATPVLLVAFYPSPEAPGGERVALCGPVGEQPVVHLDVEISQAERLAEVALREPSHHAATRSLATTSGVRRASRQSDSADPVEGPCPAGAAPAAHARLRRSR